MHRLSASNPRISGNPNKRWPNVSVSLVWQNSAFSHGHGIRAWLSWTAPRPSGPMVGLAKNAVIATFLAAAVNLRITRTKAQNAGTDDAPVRKRDPPAHTTRIQAERARGWHKA
jgi:hypothetical protein